MKRSLILILIASNLSISCASFSKKVTFDNDIILKKETVSKLNGIYEVGATRTIRKFENQKPQIIEKDTLNRFALFETLKETNQQLREDINSNITDYKVKIQVQTEETISFTLLKNEQLIDSIKMKFEFTKDGFIYLKNKNFKTKGVPVIAGNFELNRTKIGLNENNNLILYNSYFIYGAVLVIIGDTRKSNFGSEYKRKI